MRPTSPSTPSHRSTIASLSHRRARRTWAVLQQLQVEVRDLWVVGPKVFGTTDQYLVEWDPRTGEVVYRQTDWRGHRCLSVTPDGRRLVSVSLGGRVCVQRVDERPQLLDAPKLSWRPRTVEHVEFGDGHVVAILSEAERLHLVDIDLKSGVDRRLEHEAAYEFGGAALVTDQLVCTISRAWTEPGVATVFGADTLELAGRVRPRYHGAFAAMSRGLITSASSDGTMSIYDINRAT